MQIKRDPFVVAAQQKQQHPLMVFEEIPILENTHWLTDFPVQSCREYKVGNTRMLCSGSVMGSREGIMDYLETMVEEFDYWKTRVSSYIMFGIVCECFNHRWDYRFSAALDILQSMYDTNNALLFHDSPFWKEKCRIDMRGDDQSIHNYLYYTNRLKNAVSIPHRTGPIHVVGYQAARIHENATKEAEEKGINVADLYKSDEGDGWQNWLPEKYDLIDPKTGLIVNMDGSPSAQVS